MRKDEFPIVDKFVQKSINEMLDKIRADIEKEIVPRNSDQYDYEAKWQNLGLRMALKVIDKYKAEGSEERGMTNEEAEDYAKEMTYRDAVYNALQGKCIPYRKATLIKLYELLDMVEPQERGKE